MAQIAKNIGKNRSTVGREIKAHRRLVVSSKGNNCVHHDTCTRVPQCRSTCHRGKRQCQSACGGCIQGCPDYQEEFFQEYDRSPFVCNACDHRLRYRLRRMLYDAKHAQEQYESTLSESRKGISLTEAELDGINDLQVVLTDRGSEFTDPMRIEADTESGEIQCRVFYCDPMNSSQKSHCERNHEFIRYVIPKGEAKDEYTEEEIMRLMNHIGSYPRKKWNGQSPIDLFVKIYGQETATLLGLNKVPSDSINLAPALLK